MSLAFWFSLVVCVGAFLEAIIDHRETLEAFRKSVSQKEKRWHGFKLWVYWVVFALALIGVVVTGWESSTSDRTSRIQSEAITNATQQIAKQRKEIESLSERLAQATNSISSTDPRKQPIISATATARMSRPYSLGRRSLNALTMGCMVRKVA